MFDVRKLLPLHVPLSHRPHSVNYCLKCENWIWISKVWKTTSETQTGDVDKHGSPPHTTTAKITTRPQSKYHPQLSENRAMWKSDNQRSKEATFIQMGGGMERCGDRNGWSHIHMWWIKNRRDALGVSNPSPSSDHPPQGSSAKKISPHNFWL